MNPDDTQDMGAYVVAKPGAYVTMHCEPRFILYILADANHVADKYNDTSSNYDQTVSLNGTVVSRLSTRESPI